MQPYRQLSGRVLYRSVWMNRLVIFLFLVSALEELLSDLRF